MRCFIDMDGVLADYDREVRERNERLAKNGLPLLTPDQAATIPGIFRELQPVAGAIEAVPEILAMGYDVYIASKPAPSHPDSYQTKAAWVIEWLPMLKKKLILTQDKGLLGQAGDVIVDDRPHKANVIRFPGHILHFGGEIPDAPIRAERCTWVPNWATALRALHFLRG